MPHPETSFSSTSFLITALRVDHQERSPIIDDPLPAFSWALESDRRETRQIAFQIVVVRLPERTAVWDSGWTESSDSTHVRYAGQPLESNRDYRWKITAWDNHGNQATGTASFTTTLLDSAEWQARWIGSEIEMPGLLLRHEFSLPKPVRRARVFCTGLGFYELRVNGQKAGDAVLTPGRTHYEKQVLYDAPDVAALLREGPNALGILLGNGWFNIAREFEGWREEKYGAPRAIMQLHVTFEDSTETILFSDGSWKMNPGPVTADCLYGGESFDARREPDGWDRPGFSAGAAWAPAEELTAPGGEMRVQAVPNRITATLPAIRRLSPQPGTYVFDFGQNFAGWVRMKVRGAEGTTVRLRHGESLHEDGTLNPLTNGDAKAADHYTLNGCGVEIYEPRFTYHGFRYVEVTGYPGIPEPEDFAGCVIHSDCPPAGAFACSNELLNHIHHCTVWSQRSSLQGGVQVDCPQRAERLGWLADAHVTVDEAFCNFDMASFYGKWLRDMRSVQTAEGAIPYVVPRKKDLHSLDWSAGYLIIAWSFFRHTGDRRILEDHYPAFVRYLDYLQIQAGDGVFPPSRYGDWWSVAQNHPAESGWVRGTPALTTSGYYYHCADLLRRIAKTLGKEDDAEKYSRLKSEIGAAFNREFFDPIRGIYRSEPHAFQFAQTFPLWLGLVPESEKPRVLAGLIRDLTETQGNRNLMGILGARYLPDVLNAAGRADLVYRLANRRGYPSWDSLTRDRTTLAERWNGEGSGNHVMFGSIDGWFYQTLAGLEADPEKPGYARVRIRPFIPDELNHAEASIRTVRGRVAVGWRKRDGDLILKIEVPANSEALVWVPGKSAEAVREGGLPAAESPGVRFIRQETNHLVFATASGRYEFQSAFR